MATPLQTLIALTLGCILSTSTVAITPPDPVPPVQPPAGPASTFPAVQDFTSSGPYTTTSSRGGSCTFYHPRPLGEEGVRHPIILWGNGTGGTPSTYGTLLRHWASHGFVVAAANTSNAGTGAEMLDCLDHLSGENSKNGSVFAGKLDLARTGAAGHSQGGGGALMAGRDPRIKATVPFEPYVLGLGHDTSSQEEQSGPMLLLAGSADTLVIPSLNQDRVFRATNVPVFYGTLQGADHFAPVGDGGGFRGPATAWFRYHLMEDQSAGKLFVGTSCTLCGDRNWVIQKKGLN